MRYRVYTLDAADHVRHGSDLLCDSHKEALEQLARLPMDQTRELWLGASHIARVEPRHTSP